MQYDFSSLPDNLLDGYWDLSNEQKAIVLRERLAWFFDMLKNPVPVKFLLRDGDSIISHHDYWTTSSSSKRKWIIGEEQSVLMRNLMLFFNWEPCSSRWFYYYKSISQVFERDWTGGLLSRDQWLYVVKPAGIRSNLKDKCRCTNLTLLAKLPYSSGQGVLKLLRGICTSSIYENIPMEEALVSEIELWRKRETKFSFPSQRPLLFPK